MGLVSLYFANGLLDDAISETEALIKTEYQNRAMLNHYKGWDCELPRLVIKVLIHKFEYRRSYFAAVEAKYAMLLYSMVISAKCRSYEVYMEPENSKRYSNMIKSVGISHVSDEALCSDAEVQNYLYSNEVTLHPCREFQQMVDESKFCAPFRYVFPPPSEPYEGTANLYDIIFNAYRGDFSRFLRSPFRILFAEYFDAKALYRLFTTISALNVDFEIVVLSSDNVYLGMRISC